MNKVWDLVSGKRIRPAQAPALVFGEGISNQVTIDAANNKINDYDEDFQKAAFFLVDAISDSELLSVTTVTDDPITIWNKLQQKFARKSEMGKSAAQKGLLHFANLETEIPEETICNRANDTRLHYPDYACFSAILPTS